MFLGVTEEAIVIDPQEVFTVVKPDCTFETTPFQKLSEAGHHLFWTSPAS